jgi:hypothetical protein
MACIFFFALLTLEGRGLEGMDCYLASQGVKGGDGAA